MIINDNIWWLLYDNIWLLHDIIWILYDYIWLYMIIIWQYMIIIWQYVIIICYYPLDRAEYQAFDLIGLKRSIYVRKWHHFGNYKPALPYDYQDARSRCKQTNKINCKRNLWKSYHRKLLI